jgi:hypothetical protein
MLSFSSGSSPTKADSQFASRVVNFSSQYGTNLTDAYVARNLAGDRHISRYGDFTEAFVLVRLLARHYYPPCGVRSLDGSSSLTITPIVSLHAAAVGHIRPYKLNHLFIVTASPKI